MKIYFAPLLVAVSACADGPYALTAPAPSAVVTPASTIAHPEPPLPDVGPAPALPTPVPDPIAAPDPLPELEPLPPPTVIVIGCPAGTILALGDGEPYCAIPLPPIPIPTPIVVTCPPGTHLVLRDEIACEPDA